MRNPFRYLLEYSAARVAAFLFQTLPLPLAAKVGIGIGELFFRFDRRHRERVIAQAERALGGWAPYPDGNAFARAVYHHFGTMLAEFVRIPSMTKENVAEIVDWNGHDLTFRQILSEGKGLIFVTGHIGNWEVCGSAFALEGFSAGAIARPLDNPLLDQWVCKIRRASGQEIWDKFGALRSVLRVLREGKGFGILADQDAGKRGVFVPFFGIPCSTIPTAADLALRTGAPMIATCLHRTDRPMRFRCFARPIRIANPKEDPQKERIRLLTVLNEDLEACIRQAPEQWLWLHRRWKTQPEHPAHNRDPLQK